MTSCCRELHLTLKHVKPRGKQNAFIKPCSESSYWITKVGLYILMTYQNLVCAVLINIE